MNIGIYFARSDPTLGGGFTFESSIVDTILERRLDALDEVTLIGPRGSWRERARRKGIRTIGWPPPRVQRIVSEAEARFRQPRARRDRDGARSAVEVALAEAEIDVLWSLGPSVPSMNVPFIITVWDLQHRHQPWFPEVNRRGEWERREAHYSVALRRATRVIVGNSQGQHEVERYYGVPSDRIVCAPHPVPAWVSEIDRSDPVAPPDDPFVLYPAQFWAHKNHYHLLHALRHLKDGGSPIRCVLVGSDGGNKSYVQSLIARLELEDHVIMKGFVSNAELAKLYRQATAVVYPSLFGPENLPPLEAMALGTPVIAARVAGTQEQLGEAALMVDPLDAKQLAVEILRVASDESLRNDLVRRGTTLVEKRTPQRFIDTVLDAVSQFISVRHCWDTSGIRPTAEEAAHRGGELQDG